METYYVVVGPDGLVMEPGEFPLYSKAEAEALAKRLESAAPAKCGLAGRLYSVKQAGGG